MAGNSATATPAPKSTHIIVDIGSKKKGQIKRLRKGEGELMDEVDQCIQELRASGKIDGAAQPVILIVKEKGTGFRQCPLCMVARKMQGS